MSRLPRALDRPRTAEAALWLGAAVGGAVALATWRRPPSGEAAAATPNAAPSAAGARGGAPDILHPPAAALATYDPFRLANSDPFRFAHRPAQVPFGAPAPTAAAPAAPIAPTVGVPPKPRLALLGIVGAAGRWQAVLGGAPGHDAGALVRSGDTLGGLHVRRVTAESVVVQARDTTWRLALGGAGGRP